MIMNPQSYSTNYNMNDSPSPVPPEFFGRHVDSVLCCSIDERIKLAVSGGIDDTAFVWDLNNKHVIFECVGHKESVVAAGFSYNSTYVATGDLNGYIQVRNTITGIKIFDYDIDEINWIKWHNASEFVLIAGTIKGEIWMWNVNDPAAMKTFPSYGHATTGARLYSDGMKLVTSYSDGSVRVFDLKTKQAIIQLSDSSQSEIISLDLSPNNALVVIGCIDSTVKLINLNASKVIGSLTCKTPDASTSGNPQMSGANTSQDTAQTSQSEIESGTAKIKVEDDHVEEEEVTANIPSEPIEVIDEYTGKDPDKGEQQENLSSEDDDEDEDEDEEMMAPVESVESVLFSPCGSYIAAANNSGSIYIWDVATQVVRSELHSGIGITRSAWLENGNYLTGCLDGSIRIYDVNLNKVSELTLHTDQILDLDYRSRVLVTASEDKTCKVVRLGE